MGRNIHFDFAKIFCSIKCCHLKIKSQFKLGILEHHDIRCHWCEAWFLTFWSICQSGKVGLVGFFSKGEHWTICAWGAPYCLSALSPLIPLIPYLQLGAALSSYLWQLAYLSDLDDSLAVAVLHSFNLEVWKSISAITNQIQGMGDESIWIHQTAVNVWM